MKVKTLIEELMKIDDQNKEVYVWEFFSSNYEGSSQTSKFEILEDKDGVLLSEN